mmetsp:Transcript_12627/g.30066  ORF Transcript_12627/g.30066 Transcript_12627/m.30066 type:complete len:284 (-) Transcript_12627:926-1777(-)
MPVPAWSDTHRLSRPAQEDDRLLRSRDHQAEAVLQHRVTGASTSFACACHLCHRSCCNRPNPAMWPRCNTGHCCMTSDSCPPPGPPCGRTVCHHSTHIVKLPGSVSSHRHTCCTSPTLATAQLRNPPAGSHRCKDVGCTHGPLIGMIGIPSLHAKRAVRQHGYVFELHRRTLQCTCSIFPTLRQRSRRDGRDGRTQACHARTADGTAAPLWWRRRTKSRLPGRNAEPHVSALGCHRNSPYRDPRRSNGRTCSLCLWHMACSLHRSWFRCSHQLGSCHTRWQTW